jgi:hypothetical protein
VTRLWKICAGCCARINTTCLLESANFGQEHEELALSIAADHGLPFITRLTVLLRAEALLNLGRVEEGTAEMRRLRADLEQEDASGLQLLSYMGLAGACGLSNHTEESLRNLARALELVHNRPVQFPFRFLHARIA